MKFKILTEERDLITYAKLTAQYLQIDFPLDYLKKSKVVVVVNELGHICGGYTLVTKGPLRVAQSLPDWVLNQNPRFKKKLNSCFELTGLWLDPMWAKKTQVTLFWLRLYWDVIRTKKKYMIYAYSLNKPKLKKVYSVARPQILYRGFTKKLPGMRAADEESVEIASTKGLLLTPLISPQFFLKKLIFSRRLKKNCHFLSSLKEMQKERQWI